MPKKKPAKVVIGRPAYVQDQKVQKFGDRRLRRLRTRAAQKGWAIKWG